VRTVAYQRLEKVVVIYDWASSSISRKWELNFQAPTEPKLTRQTTRIDNNGASACIDVYGMPSSAKLSNGFPVAPEKAYPDQYQARYTATSASLVLVAVTVIREDCRVVPVNVSFAGTSAKVSINGGAALVLDRRTVIVPALGIEPT
jgi:hypothetical protein